MLSADGNGNGTVGPEDYELWKTNFGSTVPAAAATSANNVPEPTTMLAVAVGRSVGLVASAKD